MKIRAMVNRAKSNEQTIKKDDVREWMFNELIERYNYPIDWLKERTLLINENNFYGFTLNTDDGHPFIIVSIAVPGDIESAEKNLSSFFEEKNFIGIGIVTDGSEEGTKVVSKKSGSKQEDYIVDIENYKLHNEKKVIINNFENAGDKELKTQRLLSEKVESVFFEAHSHIRDIDGLHMDEALDELCKVIYCKIFDESETLIGVPIKMQRTIYGSNEELAANIRGLYKKANESTKKYLGYAGVFNTEIKLSSAALAKVVEIFQNFNLTRSNVDIKGRAFQKVLSPTMRAGMGQYFTPLQIIQLMVNIVQPTKNEIMLDPFCGSGHFLLKTLEYIKNSIVNNKKDYLEILLKEFSSNNLHGIEKSDRMVRIAMTDLMLHGDGSTNIRCYDSLLDFRNYTDLKAEYFDIILTNPPFGSLLGREAFMQIGHFELTEGFKSVPLEVIGLERCLQFLRPGGKMAIVLPDGILANKRTQYVRDWLQKHAKIRAIISLPVETFSPFGANIKTSILFLRKWDVNEIIEENYNICLAQIENIGYDAAGRDKKGSELEEVQEALVRFLNEEGW
jgi:type I restriction enzyme M protein